MFLWYIGSHETILCHMVLKGIRKSNPCFCLFCKYLHVLMMCIQTTHIECIYWTQSCTPLRRIWVTQCNDLNKRRRGGKMNDFAVYTTIECMYLFFFDVQIRVHMCRYSGKKKEWKRFSFHLARCYRQPTAHPLFFHRSMSCSTMEWDDNDAFLSLIYVSYMCVI